MNFLVITAGGSLTPVMADSADAAREIIEQKHGWEVLAVLEGVFLLDGYTHPAIRNRRWYHVRMRANDRQLTAS